MYSYHQPGPRTRSPNLGGRPGRDYTRVLTFITVIRSSDCLPSGDMPGDGYLASDRDRRHTDASPQGHHSVAPAFTDTPWGWKQVDAASWHVARDEGSTAEVETAAAREKFRSTGPG